MKKYSKEENNRAAEVFNELLKRGADEGLIRSMSRAEREKYLYDFKKGEVNETIDSESDDEEEVFSTTGNEPSVKFPSIKVYPHIDAMDNYFTEKDKELLMKDKFIAVIYCGKNYPLNKTNNEKSKFLDLSEFLDFLEGTFGEGKVIQVQTTSCNTVSIIDQLISQLKENKKRNLGVLTESASFYAYFGDNFLENEPNDPVRISRCLLDRLTSMNLIKGEIYSLTKAIEEYENKDC